MEIREANLNDTVGYKAIQFNFVVSTNAIAVELWKKFGFRIIGTIPKAFNHQTLGYVGFCGWVHYVH